MLKFAGVSNVPKPNYPIKRMKAEKAIALNYPRHGKKKSIRLESKIQYFQNEIKNHHKCLKFPFALCKPFTNQISVNKIARRTG